MFRNMDQIVDYVNAHSVALNATMRYGTLDQYQNADLVCRGTWARVTIDHFRHSALQNV
jgi:hypothetical protein